MTRRIPPWLALWPLALLLLAPGCADTTPPPAAGSGTMAEGRDDDTTPSGEPGEDSRAILDSVIRLIRDAATNPGGKNFDIATENLNAYFRKFRTEDFAISETGLTLLRSQMSEPFIAQLLERNFSQRDGRHIEDNLLYRAVAARVAGEGDDLTRVRRVFDYVIRHVMLVPPGALSPQPGIAQAQARPYDVLLRGMATEDGNGWSERAWLFMVLCRQLGLDAGLVVYTPRPSVGPLARTAGAAPLQRDRAMVPLTNREQRVWTVAVLVGGKPYLFDAAIGMPIPSPDGKGVATLEQAITDPRCLAQLEIPGRDYYGPTQADLARRPVRVLLESSLGGLSPKMRLLQNDLGGQNQMVLYRDPVEQVQAFQAALGSRCDGVALWTLPLTVEFRLFNPGPGNFIDATLFPLQFFEARWPLLGVRLMQLRGDTADAIQSYAVMRFADSAVQTDGKTRIPPQVQGILDLYATYYLALAQMEKGDAKQAKALFAQALEMLPEAQADPRQPFLIKFRWGAISNLGRLYAESSDPAERAAAARYLAQDIPTLQSYGDLLRARALIGRSPFVPPKEAPKVVAPAAVKSD